MPVLAERDLTGKQHALLLLELRLMRVLRLLLLFDHGDAVAERAHGELLLFRKSDLLLFPFQLFDNDVRLQYRRAALLDLFEELNFLIFQTAGRLAVRLTGGNECGFLHLQCVVFPLKGVALLTEFGNFRLARACFRCRFFTDLIEQIFVFGGRGNFALQIVHALRKA